MKTEFETIHRNFIAIPTIWVEWKPLEIGIGWLRWCFTITLGGRK